MIYDATDPDGHRALRQLGLDLDTLEQVLAYGDAERQTYTAFDARSVPEAARWSRHNRLLSEILVPQGWSRIDPMNQPTLVHPSQTHSLITASGDGSTGRPYAAPTTKNPKGESIRNAVRANADLVLLTPQDVDPRLEGLRATWIFLTSPIDESVFSEVSLPTDMDGDYITSWRDRILLPEWRPDGGFVRRFRGGGEPDAGYDVPVTRR